MSENEPTPAVAIGGHVQGGNQPLAFATATIYETANNGVATNGVYVGNASILGVVTTDSNGNFAFGPPGVSCSTSTDYTYITITQGSAGNTGTTNPDTLLIAYSGPCTAIQAYTWVNEVTTVAMAYALSGFTSITSSCTTGSFTASPCVNITASSTNYATVTPTGTFSMAGLKHALANAQNLANFGGSGIGATNAQGTAPGQANTTVALQNASINSSTQASIMPSFVPAAEINSIADVLQVCVNSNGGNPGIVFSTPSPASPPNGTSATSTLTLGSASGVVAGTVSISVAGGSALTGTIPAGTTGAAAFVTAFNNIAAFSGANIVASSTGNVVTVTGPPSTMSTTNSLSFTGTKLTYSAPASPSFSTPTTPTGTAGATATLSFPSATTGINGSISISLAGGSALTGTVSGTTSPATFVTAFNANTSFSSNAIVATSAGNIVTVTGPQGTSNTLSFTGTSLSDLAPAAADGSTCGGAFSAMPSLAGVLPTNTLQAALNLAKNPAGDPVGVFNYIPASSGQSFTPTLTAVPPDWTISVVYTPEYQAGSSTVYTYPYYLTIDASDNVYTQIPNASSASTGTSLYSMTSSGYLNYATGGASTGQTCPGPSCTINSTTSTAGSTSGSTQPVSYSYEPNVYNIAADGYGNLWAPLNGGTSPTYPVLQINASTGNVIQSYYIGQASTKGVAVDKNGDIWFGRQQTTNNLLYEIAYNGTGVANAAGNGSGSVAGASSSACSGCGVPYGPYISTDSFTGIGYGPVSGLSSGDGAYGMVIDKNQNIWYAGYYSAGTTIVVLPAQASSTVSVTACTNAGVTSTIYGAYTGLQCSGLTSTNTTANTNYKYGTLGTGTTPYGVAVDSSGNGWIVGSAGGTPALQEFSPTYTSGYITSFPSSPTHSYSFGISTSSARFIEADGAGNIWIPDAGQIGIIQFNTNTSTFVSQSNGYQPCLVVNNACGSENNSIGGTVSALTGVREVMIDSTGSIWIPAGTSSKSSGFNNIVQIIGTAAPTWWPGATNTGVMP